MNNAPVILTATRQRATGSVVALTLLLLPLASSGVCIVGGLPLASTDRFARFEESFAIWNRMRNVGWAGSDESALRAHYSFKYRFTPEECLPEVPRRSSEIFFSYTGEFDFYVGTRNSGPVINRISNPAIHWRATERDGSGQKMDFGVGVEHRSDGQAVEVTSDADASRAQSAYAARDYRYFDEVSRGANFVSLFYNVRSAFEVENLQLRAKAKLYLSKDSRVTWGPLSGGGASISNYDLVALLVKFKTRSMGSVEVEWTIGDKGFSTDSVNIGWHTNPNSALPLYVRVHIGPMNTLSNYSQRQDSVGVGLRFDTP